MILLLEVSHLIKRYKDLLAVDRVAFAIDRGICFGLLGPNGAGKTTTIEMIEGIIAPTAGEIRYTSMQPLVMMISSGWMSSRTPKVRSASCRLSSGKPSEGE